MTQRLLKTIFSLLLTILFLVTCMVLMVVIFVGAWLHTYNAFTARTLVAKVQVSIAKTDENGAYTDVVFTPYQQESALVSLLLPQAPPTTSIGTSQTYKIYGDTVHVGGPIVKFYDHLILVNFQSIYKLTQLYGRYDLDITAENNRKVNSNYELNGGTDGFWPTLNDRQQQWPYNMFIDAVQMDAPGVFVSKLQNFSYKLYITNTGFLWEQE